MQTLGGMSGAIVVEDPEGSLPSEVEQMREVVMVLQETNIESGVTTGVRVVSGVKGVRVMSTIQEINIESGVKGVRKVSGMK